MKLVLALLVSLGFVLLAQAEVYKSVDENGNVTFTDSPDANDTNAKPVQLPPINSQPAPTVRPPSPKPPEENIPKKYNVRIAAPANDTQILADQTSVSVSVATEPGVHVNHRIEIYDNGRLVSNDGSSITLSNLLRGTHSISAKVVNERGKVLGSSSSIQFHVFRPSINTRRILGL